MENLEVHKGGTLYFATCGLHSCITSPGVKQAGLFELLSELLELFFEFFNFSRECIDSLFQRAS